MYGRKFLFRRKRNSSDRSKEQKKRTVIEKGTDIYVLGLVAKPVCGYARIRVF